MKQYIIAALLCVASLTISAQVTLRDSSGNFIAGYAGLVGVTSYLPDTTIYNGNVRLGGSWNLNLSKNKKFTFSGFGFYQTGQIKPVVASIRVQYQPSKHFWVMLGENPSAGALILLPPPASVGGQFQVTAQNMITGVGTGILARWGKKNWQVLASAQRRQNRYNEYQICAVWRQFSVLATVEADTITRYAASIQMDTKSLTLIATANQQKIGGFVGFPIGRGGYRALCDIGYSRDGASWAVEPGVVRNWKVGVLRVKGAITWVERSDATGRHHSLNLYVLLTL